MQTVTLVICTYNRPQLLKKCLQSLDNQTADPKQFAILVVDNYGDQTLEEALKATNVSYIHEASTGLSVARNRGAVEAKTDWVFYLDDDGIAHSDMIEQFLNVINDPGISVIGGRYEHYFAAPPAKWLLRYYDAPVRAAEGEVLVTLTKQQYLSGGIMAAKRDILLKYPFQVHLGMKGLQPGFGEENEWQDRLRTASIPIHYYDKIAMNHLVQAHKQSLSDRIRLAYAHGRYFALTDQTGSQNPSPRYFPEVLKVVLQTFPYDLARTIFKPGFYWQNGLVSTLGKLAFLRGKYGK